MSIQKPNKDCLQIRIDHDLKLIVTKVLASQGMNISEAVRLYLWQIAAQNGIPYKGFVTAKLTAKPTRMNTEVLDNLDYNFRNVQMRRIGAFDPANAKPSPELDLSDLGETSKMLLSKFEYEKKLEAMSKADKEKSNPFDTRY